MRTVLADILSARIHFPVLPSSFTQREHQSKPSLILRMYSSSVHPIQAAIVECFLRITLDHTAV